MRTNKQIVKDGAVTTSVVTSGLLQPYQAKKFLRQTFDATPLMGAIRHETRTERKGEIDKIGVGRRLLRRKVENTDDGYRAKPNFGSIEYSCNPVRLPWEITEDTLRENIEGEDLETTITNLMTTQIGVDSEDLIINGDEATSSENPDYDFLKLDDGVIKQVSTGGHILDVTGSSNMELEMFYKAVASIPNKYNNGKLRWLMSPTRAQQWELFLLNKVINAGGAVPEALYKSPVAIPSMQVPNLADDIVILIDPKNITEVNTYTVKIRKDATSKDAIMQDKRFYVVHFDLDTLIEELDATAIIKGLPAYTFS
ncbi:MAG: phage major capsid protein [Blautia sp.]|nr:phage major capsid protein [Blautia sp.]